ncbi:tyrosine-type recombinase/integrase [Bradyrhizobium japonicum]|uniref:tyrosine-type recombinase/integrase n=1 Tax=Bradyrhizobium japonicum TaxID=375 RepID=UPI001BA7CC33|nr:site-specific integrase [Bradyrhizobium japonicum]MBR0913871.1 site-specific integrase [Bradyrhizobium japonicum]
MGVHKPKGTRNWQVIFQYKRRKFSFSSGTASREEALAQEPAWREEAARLMAAENASGPQVTFNQAMGKYYMLRVLDPRPQDEKSDDQLEREIAYWDRLQAVGALVGLETLCSAVDTDRMVKIKDTLLASTAATASGRLKNSSINKQTGLIFAVLNVARDHMGCPLPHRPRMKEVRLSENERDQIIDYDDETDICRHLPEECHAPFVFELETGLRRGDVIGLKWSRVKLKGKVPVVMAHRKDKGRKLYPVPLNARALKVLADMKGAHAEFVFTRAAAVSRRTDGEMRVETVRAPFEKRSFSKVMKKAFVAAGHADLTFHDLRRTAGTRFYLETRDYEATRRFLGHGSIEVTKRYIKVALADVAAGVVRMDRARRGRGWKLIGVGTVKSPVPPPAEPTADAVAA